MWTLIGCGALVLVGVGIGWHFPRPEYARVAEEQMTAFFKAQWDKWVK